MTSKSWISWFGVPFIAFALTVGVLVSTVHAVGDAHKVSVVSFGLFGDQGVFRSEATGAAEVVAGRFGGGPINVKYNSKKGGGATIETLDMSLQAAANGMDGRFKSRLGFQVALRRAWPCRDYRLLRSR